MNRRQFMCTAAGAAAAGAATFARVRDALAASYDLVIRGGRVIDPSVGLDAVRDVAIGAGRIAAIDANIAAEAADTIDARGKIVAPGLIDIHTHAARALIAYLQGPAIDQALKDDGMEKGRIGCDQPISLLEARSRPSVVCIQTEIRRP